MTRKYLRAGCATCAIVAAALVAKPAMAAGTAAGSNIVNTVSVDYTVGGVNQDDVTASDTIVVDRKVNVTVARIDNNPTNVTPGATNQAVSFQIENLSNATLDFELTTLQTATGNPAGITGNDGFDVVAPLTFYRDTNGNNVYDAGTDTLITHLDALAPDAPVTVHVVAASIPNGLANGLRAALSLTATARENNNGTGLGTVLTESTSNTAGMDTIFADASSGIAGDTARNAAFSATDDYLVVTAAITATKTSTILSNSANFSTGTAIPGATVQYCITVSNTGGGAAATGVTISDTLPANLTYDGAYGVRVGGANCSTPGGNTGTHNSGVVSGTIGTLNIGASQTVIFQATIN